MSKANNHLNRSVHDTQETGLSRIQNLKPDNVKGFGLKHVKPGSKPRIKNYRRQINYYK